MNDVQMNEIIKNTGKNPNEKYPEALGFMNEELHTGLMGTVFSFVSNIHGIKKLFELASKYLFPIAFAMKLADWLFYTWKYSQSSNKNLGKTTNLLIKTLTTPLMGLAVFGTALIGAAAAPFVFISVVAADVAMSLGKSIYFGVKAALTKDHENTFYKDKAKENGIKVAVGLIAIAAVAVGLIFAPHIAAIVVGAVMVTAVVTLVTVGVMALVKRVRDYKAAKAAKAEVNAEPIETNKVEPNVKNDLKTENTQENIVANEPKKVDTKAEIQEPNAKDNSQNPQKEEKKNDISNDIANNPYAVSNQRGFFANRVNLLKPMAKERVKRDEIDQLEKAINHHKEQLEIAIAKDNGKFVETYIWSEGPKRRQKIAALDLLSTFIQKFDEILASEGFKYIDNPERNPFKAKKIADVIDEVDKYVTTTNEKAFQSFFKDVGGVEALFKQTYKLLVRAHKQGLEPKPEQEVVKQIS